MRAACITLWLTCLLVLVIATCFVSCRCERPVEPTTAGSWEWAYVPVGIQIAADVGYERELRAAIREWNNAAGCEVFVLADDGPIRITQGDDHETVRGWTEVHAVGDRITRAEITLHGVTDAGMAYRVFMHELGRALALEGAYWPEPESSVMHNDIASRTEMPWLVTYADRGAVRARYCDEQASPSAAEE